MIYQLIFLGIVSLTAISASLDTYGCDIAAGNAAKASNLLEDEQWMNECRGTSTDYLPGNAPPGVVAKIPDISELALHKKAYTGAKVGTNCGFDEGGFKAYSEWSDNKAAELFQYREEHNYKNVASVIEEHCKEIRALLKSMLGVGINQEG